MVAVVALLSIPLANIVASLFQAFSDVFSHLASTVLKDYVSNSLLLMLGVACGTFVLGTSCAWLTSMCHFPGRRIFEWALLLPMAMPAYIIAYTYTGMLDFAGPVQTFLREYFQWRYGDYWFPQIRSLGGAIVMFCLVLYPYVFLIVRASFLEQSHALLEVSRSLGRNSWQTFFSVAIPAARPAIIAGMTLALMETLADYGTVQYFGVSTFTTGIFRTWFGLGDITAAAQLSSILLLFITALIVIERRSRSRMRFHAAGNGRSQPARKAIEGWPKYLAIFWCLIPVSFGFALPAGQLLIWVIKTWQDNINAAFFNLVLSSFTLAAVTSILCLTLAIALCFCHRLIASRTSALLLRVGSLGYALPGTVIAVGVLIPFAAFDNAVDAWLIKHVNISSGLLLSGTLAAVIFAYVVRFISVSIQTIESGYAKIHPSIDDSARTLGKRPHQLLSSVHLPMLKTSLLTALLLVFVDVLKELPTTLILRPFNFNTLAVRAYELASDERLMDASSAALAIVLTGLLPVLLLSRNISKPKQQSKPQQQSNPPMNDSENSLRVNL
ncbi:MAG: iron ABC transporter permease [Alteromonadaceae bacterium]|nr:MAG: iron ABC transporter permease [Alteromonadaceae bacterium]